MPRSRSSFEGLDLAIARAAALTGVDDGKSSAPYMPGAPLVSFDQPIPSMASPSRDAEGSARAPEQPVERPIAGPPKTLVTGSGELLSARLTRPVSELELAQEPAPADTAAPEAAPAQAPEPSGASAQVGEDALGEKRLPPKLPDLSTISNPLLRCEKIVGWIAEATGATDVFLVDSTGYPLAGAIDDAEAKLAAVGVVERSLSSLADSIPGAMSHLFELHLGEGPFLQLVGFKAGATMYIVGFLRSTPLTPRQSHAIRLACRHALGDAPLDLPPRERPPIERPPIERSPADPPHTQASPPPEPPPAAPQIEITEIERELPPRTLEFPSTGTAILRAPTKQMPVIQSPLSDVDRLRLALEYLREHAPEPHVAHLRVALRAGITPMALERFESLPAPKIAMIESAIEDILGVHFTDTGAAS